MNDHIRKMVLSKLLADIHALVLSAFSIADDLVDSLAEYDDTYRYDGIKGELHQIAYIVEDLRNEAQVD